MSLTAALYSAKSGLIATQLQTSIGSDNIANALTPGYVKRDAKLTSQWAGGSGLGVVAASSRKYVDPYLLRDIRLEASALSASTYRSAAAGAIADETGQPGDERSLDSAFARFEASFQALSDSPDSPIAQRDVLERAKDLVSTFGRLQSAIVAERTRADKAIADGVAVANKALQDLEDIDAKIRVETAAGRDPSGLLDERDRLIDQLSEQLGVRTFVREDGGLVVTTKEGVTLLDGRARQIDFTPASVVGPGSTLGAGLSGLSVEGADITPFSGASQAATAGAIAGGFAARDVDLPKYQVQIDEAARRTIDLFQTVDASVAAAGPPATGLFTDAGAYHDAGAPPDPVPGLAGRISVNAFVDPAAGGDLRRIKDGVQSAPGAPGDATQILAFLQGLNTPQTYSATPGLSASGTLREYATEIGAGHQTDRVSFEVEAERHALVFETLESRRLNESGVNVDEETQRLLELEQAYAANAQVISAVARMFDDLLANIR